jgi:hypothetical protein
MNPSWSRGNRKNISEIPLEVNSLGFRIEYLESGTLARMNKNGNTGHRVTRVNLHARLRCRENRLNQQTRAHHLGFHRCPLYQHFRPQAPL